jgi:hypothetical protein
MLHGVLALAVSIAAAAQESAPQDEAAAKEKTDPSGTWKWERTFGDNQMDYTLRLMQNEQGKLTGTYAVKRNESEREPVKLDDVKLDGNKLMFLVHRTRNDREFTINYEGVVSEDGIKGLTKANFGGEDREFEWNAKRVVTAADVIGTWQLSRERNGIVRESVLKLSKDGEKLKGSRTSSRGERELQDIKINDNKLSFHITWERDGNSVTVAYTGLPRGNSMTGFRESNFGGEARKTEFVGKRLPEESKKENSTEEVK